MSVRHFWRRFKPQRGSLGNIDATMKLAATAPVWQQARAYVNDQFPGRRVKDEALHRAIQSTRDQANATNDPVLWCAALMLQAPRAARAQEQMDQHPHGYHNKQARLFELIDFNDTYVSAVLNAPDELLETFADHAKVGMDAFCKHVGARCLSNEQYEAIVQGLSREIAVYRGATREGITAHMTSRVEDAMGIDMMLTDPVTGKTVGVDCKSSSAYYYRLKDLVKEDRLTIEEVAAGEDIGYCRVFNSHDNLKVPVVLWRIDEETYGKIQNFSFPDTAPLGRVLREIIGRYGQDDNIKREGNA